MDQKAGTDVVFNCSYKGQPRPKVIWFKGKLPLISDGSTLQLLENNGR